MIIYVFWGLIGYHTIVPEIFFWTLFASVLWIVEMLSLTEPGNGKVTWLHELLLLSEAFLFLYLFIYFLLMNQCFYLLGHIHVFFLLMSLIYMLYILNVLVWVNELISSFLPLCSLLAYHGYTKVNIGPFCLGTQLNIFPAPTILRIHIKIIFCQSCLNEFQIIYNDLSNFNVWSTICRVPKFVKTNLWPKLQNLMSFHQISFPTDKMLVQKWLKNKVVG